MRPYVPSNTNELRKMSYAILERIHNFERGHKIGKLHSKKLQGEAAVVCLLKSLCLCLEGCLPESRDALELIKLLRGLQDILDRCVLTGHVLPIGEVGYIQKLHTKLFSRLREEGIQCKPFIEDWTTMNLCLACIWPQNPYPCRTLPKAHLIRPRAAV